MLTLDQARKAYADQDESQLYIKTSKLPAGTHTFQMVSPELAMGYKLILDGADGKQVFFFPMQIDRPNYDGLAQARSWESIATKKERLFTSLCMAVWDYKAEGLRVLDLTGANIRNFFTAMEGIKDALKVKFQIIKVEGAAGASAKYSIALKTLDNGKAEICDKKVIDKPICLTNMFFGLSPINDPPMDIMEFKDNYCL